MRVTGFEPAMMPSIDGLKVRCPSHWATRAEQKLMNFFMRRLPHIIYPNVKKHIFYLLFISYTYIII